MTATSEWTTRVIEIVRVKRDDDPMRTLAMCRGPLAVHPTFIVLFGGERTQSRTQFTVTHIPTMGGLRSDLTKAEAFQLADAVAGLDWEFDTVEKFPAATKAGVKAAAAKFGPARKVQA